LLNSRYRRVHWTFKLFSQNSDLIPGDVLKEIVLSLVNNRKCQELLLDWCIDDSIGTLKYFWSNGINGMDFVNYWGVWKEHQYAKKKLVPLETQTGGHFGIFTKIKENKLAKLVGEAELEFYIQTQTKYQFILPWIPTYYGCEEIASKEYRIIIKDLTAGMYKPCVMDLKMGKSTVSLGSNRDKQKFKEKKRCCDYEWNVWI